MYTSTGLLASISRVDYLVALLAWRRFEGQDHFDQVKGQFKLTP